MLAAVSNPAALRGPFIALLLSVVGSVFLGAAAVDALMFVTGHASGIWIANALLLSFLLKTPRRYWAGIIAAGALANVVADMMVHYRLVPALLMVVGNVIEVLIIAIPLRWLKLDRTFSRTSSLLKFYALAIGPASGLSAAVAVTLFHFSQGTPFFPAVFNWYSADALGLVIVLPPLMTVRWQAMKAMFSREELVVTILLIGVVLAVMALNFFNREYPIGFLFFPAVLLLTFQRGFAGGAIGLVLSGAYFLIPALSGQATGALHGHTPREQVMIVQIFLAVVGFSVVLVGAALDERRKLERGLASAITRAEASREEAFVARDAAEKANRAKSMFLANMSHELRTPLNAVIGFSEIMHAETFGPLGDGRYREYTSLIQKAGRHLLDLINDVLDMSKIEAGKHELRRERLSVSAIVQETVSMMAERAAQADIVLKADLPPTPIWAEADKRAIKQVLLNLLSNAIKFTPEGGRVLVRARAVGGELALSVSDNGVGIPADQLHRLGNPFVQLRTSVAVSQAGTGLGLALVRALVQLHGGSLRIESTEGKGTTANVSLPVALTASLAA